MSGFTRWVDLPDGRQVELDNGVADVWRTDGTLQFHGLYDNLPDDVARYLRSVRILITAHYD